MNSNISMRLRMGVNGQGTYSMETTHRPPLRPAEEEEAGLALYMADKNKT
jgi:hypothetical protein